MRESFALSACMTGRWLAVAPRVGGDVQTTGPKRSSTRTPPQGASPAIRRVASLARSRARDCGGHWPRGRRSSTSARTAAGARIARFTQGRPLAFAGDASLHGQFAPGNHATTSLPPENGPPPRRAASKHRTVAARGKNVSARETCVKSPRRTRPAMPPARSRQKSVRRLDGTRGAISLHRASPLARHRASQ